jgi:hypothetical protein
MKIEITFRNSVATVERSKTAALLQVASTEADKLAILADAINESECITVITILPTCGKVVFTVEKSTTNSEIIDIVCDAISRVFDADTSVSYARTENAV